MGRLECCWWPKIDKTCGDSLSENFLINIDTVIGQFENEQDYKNGRLFAMAEEEIENYLDRILSSTKKSAAARRSFNIVL